jgi:two-component system sensor kinase FixL
VNKLSNLFKLRLLCLIILLASFFAGTVHAESQPRVDLAGKNVLVLHALESNVPVFELTDRGLRSTLEAGGVPIRNQFFEYLDLARNPGPEYRKVMAELMRLRYGQRKIDFIITMYPEALLFALNEGRAIFHGVPILALYLPLGFKPPETSQRIIQQVSLPEIAGTVEAALQLVPGTKRVLVVSGTHPLDRWGERRAQQDFKKWEGRLEFRYLHNLPLEAILATVSSASPGTIVLLTSFQSDATGKNYTTREVAKRLSEVSRVPVFGLLDPLLGFGIAGGYLISFENTGTQAGKLALKIMEGRQAPETLSGVMHVPPVPMFDWRQLQRWHLSESALPKGSIVINKEFTFWDLRYYMLGALAFGLAETTLIVILIVQRRRKKLAEDSLEQKREELNQFFNVSLDLLCIANTDGYFLLLNPAWERTLGYTREELMAKRFLDFVHPDDLDRTREAVSTLTSQQKVYFFENRYRCKDGTYRWLQWSSTPAGKLIYAAARDVTEHKQAEENLRKSEERFRMLVETMNEGLGVQNENGLWTYVNDELCRMLGRLPGDINGHPVTKFLDESNRNVLGEEIQKQRKQDYSPYEITWTHADGRKVTTIVSPKPIFSPEGRLKEIFAVITDITERKLAEETLKERLRFERLLSDLSARFVSITPDQIDMEIEEALRQVANFFSVTNCALVKATPEKNTAMVTHTAYAPASAPVRIGVDLSSLLPWTSEILREGGVAGVATLDDLPAEAAIDKETYGKLGVRSILTIPVSIGGSPRYALSIVSRSEERAWPEELIPRLRLVGEISITALERTQIRLQIEERLRFERLISNLSASFLNLPPGEVDAEIHKGLQTITEFFGADRCTIGLFSEDGSQLVRAFEYHSAEAEPAVESVAKEQMPWYIEQLIQGNPVVMNRVEDLPPEADKERQVCLARGMKSVLSIPVSGGGKPLGSFALVSTRTERVWPGELVQRFQSMCQVFANALQRKQMHAKIQNAAEEWQSTFDSVQDLVMVLDREFKLVRVNATSLSFFNLPLEGVVGNSCYTLMHGTSKPVEICPLAKMLKTKRHEEAELYDETRKAWFHVSVDPVLDDKAEVIRVIHTVKDITERKRAETEAFETRRELMRLERLSRMGELSASLAHELNQPLTSILSNARAALRFIQSNTLDIGELKEILQDIANDDKRAGDIIRNLRAILKPDEGEREPVLINEILRETVSLFNSEAIMRNLTVEVGFADPLPPVHANKVQIQQVLVNLMMNAAESMLDISGNKRVVVKTLATDGSAIQVAVRDFGPGVDEKELGKIFEPFFTTKRTGLGMGLSLSRSIIEAHGGHIWAQNNPDRGATFYFDLPAVRNQVTSEKWQVASEK